MPLKMLQQYFVNLLDNFLFNSTQFTEQEDGRERCRDKVFYILLDIFINIKPGFKF